MGKSMFSGSDFPLNQSIETTINKQKIIWLKKNADHHPISIFWNKKGSKPSTK
jgi:hypothetical protein